MKWLLPFALSLMSFALKAQSVTQQLQKAFQQFESDSQLKHAISSLYVIDAKTGEVLKAVLDGEDDNEDDNRQGKTMRKENIFML